MAKKYENVEKVTELLGEKQLGQLQKRISSTEKSLAEILKKLSARFFVLFGFLRFSPRGFRCFFSYSLILVFLLSESEILLFLNFTCRFSPPDIDRRARFFYAIRRHKNREIHSLTPSVTPAACHLPQGGRLYAYAVAAYTKGRPP